MTVLIIKNAVNRIVVGGEYTGVTIIGGSGIELRGVKITPPPPTNINAQAIRATNSPSLVIEDCIITGQASVVGAEPTTPGQAGLVKTKWGGEAIHFENCPNSVIRRNIMSRFHQGITFSGSNIRIESNRITDIRTSFIAGVPGNNVGIRGNFMSGSYPHNWGTGDHADWIHLWLNGSTCLNLVIADNEFDQADGVAILGLNLQHINIGVGVGKFVNTVIARNKVRIGQGQAFVLRGVSGTVSDNTMIALATGKNAAQMRVYETQGGLLMISGTKGGKVVVDPKLTVAQRSLIQITP